MLRYTSVSKRFAGGTLAVDDVSIQIPQGQFCVLLGSSGAGKSTLLRMANGLAIPTQGSVEFKGRVVDAESLKDVRSRIGMIHQLFNLVPRATVLQNVLFGALPRVAFWRVIVACFPEELQRKACRLIEQVGLTEEHLYRRVSQLSGGQQQRVAIARAFILDPDILLADEPVASLDPEISRDILGLLRRSSQRQGTTVVCSLHQLDLAKQFADRIVGLSAGRVVFDGSPDRLDESTIQTIYGGDPRQMAPRSQDEDLDGGLATPADIRVAVTEVA